ncbi:MAG TPA: phosphatase [Victivallales bacterium]|nr:phosphatase [Victivallales bacterium]
MNIKIDLHIHTVACGHAYSTFTEIIKDASEKKMETIAITEHGPAHDPKGTTLDFFNTYRVLPDEFNGVRILKGCEANIITNSGEIDLPENLLKKMDIIIASFHTNCKKSGTVEENTQAYINAMRNPYIDIIGHPDDINYFPYCPDKLVKAAIDNDVALELNNSSALARPGSGKLCIEMLKAAKKYGAKLSIGSDSHYHTSIGIFDYAIKLIKDLEIDKNKIINLSKESLSSHLRRNHIKTNWL